MTEPRFLGLRPASYYSRTPEQEAQSAAAEALVAERLRTYRERHAWMLTNAPHPILRALVEEHRSTGPEHKPVCAACPPELLSDVNSDMVYTRWPCDVWRFISVRMRGEDT